MYRMLGVFTFDYTMNFWSAIKIVKKRKRSR